MSAKNTLAYIRAKWWLLFIYIFTPNEGYLLIIHQYFRSHAIGLNASCDFIIMVRNIHVILHNYIVYIKATEFYDQSEYQALSR